MINFSWRTHSIFLGTFLAGAIILFWGLVRPPHFAIDDAYITYRYAENLRSGIGFVYNAGEPVLGTTAPMYAMLLALLSFLVPNLELLGHWLSILSWVGVAVLTGPLLLKLERPFAAAIAPLLVALQPTVLKSVGMETPLLLCLMFLVAWLWLGGHKKMTVFFAAVMLITRQDSALWLLILGMAIWQREKRMPWREAAGVVALSLPWFAFAAWRYGTILPNSAAAKIGQNSVMVVGSDISFWQQFFLLLTERAFPLAAVVIITAVLAWLAAAFLTRQWVGWWLGMWILAYTAVYTLLNVVNFNWYFVPPITVFMLLAALGLEAIGQQIDKLRLPNKLGTVVGLALLLPLLFSLGTETWDLSQTPGVRADYFTIGQWLAANSGPEETVATIEIGVIGFESKRPIIDTMGLVSTEMTNHQLGWVETLVYALDAFKPDFLVVLPNTAWDGLVTQWWFETMYEPVFSLEKSTIYQRQTLREQIVQPVDVALVSGLQLKTLSLSSITPQSGTDLDVWLTVQVAELQPENYQLTLFLVDYQGELYAMSKDFPFGGGYQSRKWQPGDELEIPMRLRLPGDLPTGGYQIGIVLFDPVQGGGVPIAAAPDQLSPNIRAGWVRLGNSPQEPFDTVVSYQPNVQWQTSLSLNELNVGTVRNDMLPLQLVWQVGQPLLRDWTIFVHLLDAQGNIVAQMDERPFQGKWPTPVWHEDEMIHQPLQIPLPIGIALNDIEGIRVGLYNGAERLPLAEGNADFWQSTVDLSAAAPDLE